MFGKKSQQIAGYADTTMYQFDHQIGFWGIPNVERDVKFRLLEGRVIRVQHNDEGNRDQSFEKNSSIKTILCMGGSHTWGGGVEQVERYSDLLKNFINRLVVNMGHCSLGLDQICIALLQRTEFYSPSVIIVEQYPWAIHRILSNYVVGFIRPHFSLGTDGNLILHKVPKICRFKVFRRIVGAFYEYRKELNEFKAGIDIKENYDPLTDPIFCYWKTFYYDYMYKLADGILRIMRDSCRQNKVKLLFAVGAIAQQFGDNSPTELIDYDLPGKNFVKLLEKNNIEYVEMKRAMLSEHSTEAPVIFPDGHLNAKGNRIFARILQKKLEALGWIDE